MWVPKIQSIVFPKRVPGEQMILCKISVSRLLESTAECMSSWRLKKHVCALSALRRPAIKKLMFLRF